MPEAIFQLAEALRHLLHVTKPEEVEQLWTAQALDSLGWEGLGRARQGKAGNCERTLDEVDGLLLRLLDRMPVLAAMPDATSVHIRTFRIPALERLQHASAATLVGHRYGVAGLRTVLADTDAPLARRYFAFLGLAELHPVAEWPVFGRYLTPGAHHAFQGAAAEAARFYPNDGPARRLIELFDAVRSDLHLRTFLSPRILQSLYVLGDPSTLSFFRELLTAGFTDHDPERCEVTRALVMVKRFTGSAEENSKYPDPESLEVTRALSDAEQTFEHSKDVLTPVVVI